MERNQASSDQAFKAEACHNDRNEQSAVIDTCGDLCFDQLNAIELAGLLEETKASKKIEQQLRVMLEASLRRYVSGRV